MAHWNTLPVELQEMIFAELYEDRERRKRHHIIAKCASLCRSWQDKWEPRNFRELVLTPSCLPKLRTILRGKKSYRFEHIKLIWLRIELEKYDCSACQTAEDERTIKKNCIIFTNALWSLLRTLSAWGNQESRQLADLSHPPGLELEISIHSPSDFEHVFRPVAMRDNYPYVTWSETRRLYPASEGAIRAWHTPRLVAIHDPPHGWIQGVHTIPNPSGNRAGNPSGKDRLFGTRYLDFDFSRVYPRLGSRDRRLPQASIVRHFTVRRAYFRGFCAKVLFKLLHESFTHIEMVRVEKWLHIYTDQHAIFEQDFTELLRRRGLPKTLRELHLLQDANLKFHPCSSWSPYNATLSLELARATRHIEHFTQAWLADAMDFFHDHMPESLDGASPRSLNTRPWNNLVTLSLTCSSFRPGSSSRSKAQRDVLRAACRAAKLMPRLDMLVIWRCGGGSAALFEFDMRYGEGGAPEILWMSTWDSNFSPQDETFQSWRELARTKDTEGREPLVRVLTFGLPPEKLASRWGLLEHIGEGLLPLHPLSLLQVKQEMLARARDMNSD